MLHRKSFHMKKSICHIGQGNDERENDDIILKGIILTLVCHRTVHYSIL